MKDGFIKVKAVSPDIILGSPLQNADLVIKEIIKAEGEGVSILAFPELCLCGCSLGDLISSEMILSASESGLEKILRETENTRVIAFVGLPLSYLGQVYSAVAVIQGGSLVALVRKPTSQSGYTLKDECRMPTKSFAGRDLIVPEALCLIECENIPNLVIGCEIGVDSTLGATLVSGGATIIVNPCACYETVTSERDLLEYAKVKSKRLNCGYVICNPSTKESTSRYIYSGHNIICENGSVLAEKRPFDRKNPDCVSEIDVNYLTTKRNKHEKNSFTALPTVHLFLEEIETTLTRKINPYPFVESNSVYLLKKCLKIFEMEKIALARRLEASYSKSMVIGISGGLDSTLALLTCVECADYLGWEREKIIAVTMPCFGTTERTKNNAISLCTALGVTLKEVNISKSVTQHLEDIGHSLDQRDVTYENAQARERTQVLMDLANKTNGLVIGTGNMSEGALGWSTYNGDQMSMYNVNASIPKTLVKKLVDTYARTIAYGNDSITSVLRDVLDTPISPELLPHNNGEIAQKTEDLVGPYDLHDFFLYNMIGRGFKPSKTYRLAKIAFDSEYDGDTIYKWLEKFIKRFFSQQFKRTATPDGITLGSVSLGKYDFQMPSDACAQAYLDDLKTVK